MRPLLLQMTAFGPFAGSESIDFTRLGDNPLFLINGPTGSGKTTILDAICFALYGKTTGDEREGGQMRCDLAVADLLTEVSLEFQLNGRRFRIRRVPEQHRPKARGDGFTEQKPEAQFCELNADGSENLLVSSKVTEATREIEDLTGLSVDQFRQVMVLPQGKFRQLLMAESAEREKIFSQLFQTRIYKQLEDRLKEQSAEIRRERDDLLKRQQGILEGAELESLEALDSELESLQPDVASAVIEKDTREGRFLAARQGLQQAEQLQQDFHRLQKVTADLEQLRQQTPQIEAARQQLQRGALAAKLLPVFAERDRCEKERSAASNRSAEAEQAKQLRIAELETTTRKKEQLPALQNNLDSAKQQLTLLEGYRQRADRLVGALAGLRVAESEAAVAELRLHGKQLLDQQTSLQQLEQLEQEKSRQQTQLEKQQAEGTRLKENFEKLEQQAKQLELDWHVGQAAILSAELQDGQPCPVCGSLEHPLPAHSDTPVPNQQQVENARQAAQQTQEKLLAARERYSEIRNRLGQLVHESDLLRTTLGAAADQSSSELAEASRNHSRRATELGVVMPSSQQLQAETIAELQTILEEKSRVKATAMSQVESAELELPAEFRNPGNLDRAVEAARRQVTSLGQQISAIERAYQDAVTRSEAANVTAELSAQQLLELTRGLERAQLACSETLTRSSFSTEQAYLHALLPEERVSDLQESCDIFQAECQRLAGGQQELQERLRGKAAPDLETFAAELKIAEQERQQAASHWQQLAGRLKLLEATQLKLQAAAAAQAELDRKYAIIGTLSDVANGQTGNKISLQRFVLSVLLDDVLIEASHRLSLMSKGRYQLLRKEDRSKGNKASGLELEVEDAYTGKVRAVATLSGGESFMAALALALGLSDVVQAYAGGIRLDTLFIDEGFGSLDPESLDLAIRTLIDLQATGRMIGIISHVAELKEQLPLRIDLLTDRLGSRTRLVTV